MTPPTLYSDWGPLAGPILADGITPAMGVHDRPDGGLPIGEAHPVGSVRHSRGLAKTYRLVVRGVELEGRWIVEGRRFVMLGDAAE